MPPDSWPDHQPSHRDHLSKHPVPSDKDGALSSILLTSTEDRSADPDQTGCPSCSASQRDQREQLVLCRRLAHVLRLSHHQQAANHSKEQFAHSPDLKTELLNAIMGALDAHNLMSTQTLNSPTMQSGMKDIMLNHAGLWEGLRAKTLGQAII